MVVVLDKNVISIISFTRVTVDAWYVMTVTKRVPIMDTINRLMKMIIPKHWWYSGHAYINVLLGLIN